MEIHCDISELPLRPTVDTFVDEPKTLDDVNTDDLIHYIENGIKDINTLHSFHAIAILSRTLRDIIDLQKDRDMFNRFRKEQLAKYDIDIEGFVEEAKMEEYDTLEERESDEQIDPSATSSSSEIDIIDDEALACEINNSASLKAGDISSRSALHSDTEDQLASEPPFKSMEDLISGFEIESSKTSSCLHRFNEKTKQEVAYCRSKKVMNQSVHLCKIFNLVKTPPISIDQFLSRIKTYSPAVSVPCYVHCAFMIFKLCILLDVVTLTDNNAYRFILGSIRCSTKKLEDIYQKQKSFATVGGVSQKDLFRIEMSFLYLCNFNLIIGEKLLNVFLKQFFVELRKFCEIHSSVIKKEEH